MRFIIKILLISLLFLSGAFLAASIPTVTTQAQTCENDTDCDTWTDTDETTYSSNTNRAQSTPEYGSDTNSTLASTCNDGTDNDEDGLVDLADSGCSTRALILRLDLDPATAGNQLCREVNSTAGAFNIDVIAENPSAVKSFNFTLNYTSGEGRIESQPNINQLLGANATYTGDTNFPDTDGTIVISANDADEHSGTGKLATIQMSPLGGGYIHLAIADSPTAVIASNSGNLIIDYERDNNNDSIIAKDNACAGWDEDEDGVDDLSGDSCMLVANAGDPNPDEDSTGNVCDTDNDNDGLNDGTPTLSIAFPDPNTEDRDTDDDGLIDGCYLCGEVGEVKGEDADNDGVVDVGETKNTDADSDEDGLIDGCKLCGLEGEIIGEDANNNGTQDTYPDPSLNEPEPASNDTDTDGLKDGTEVGLQTPQITEATDMGVFVADQDPTTQTNPTLSDTDGDGVSDGCTQNCTPLASAKSTNFFAKIYKKIVTDVFASALPGEDLNNNGRRERTTETEPSPDGPNYMDSDINQTNPNLDAPDGIIDGLDSCPLIPNAGAGQFNTDKNIANGDTIAPIFVGDDIGDICDPDDDNDGFSDIVEAGTPLCSNNINDDSQEDSLVNDGCPQVGASPESGANCNNSTDNDGDGRINDGCPVVPIGGLTEARNLGTNPLDPCGVGAWPLDLDSNTEAPNSFNRVNIRDLSKFTSPQHVNTNVGTYVDDYKFDLKPGKQIFGKDINIADLQEMAFGLPPMFGGSTRAMNGPVCPVDP